MRSLIVVERPERWPFEVEGAEVVPAREYLVEPRYAEMGRATVYHFCRRLGYQTVGYYVSLLAAARGHRPLPSVATTQALQDAPQIRATSAEVQDEIQRALSRLRRDDFTLSVYFGRNLAERYDRLSRALFNLFPAPILIARFARSDGEWRLTALRLGAASDVPDTHRDFVMEQARAYFSRRRRDREGRRTSRWDLAILWSPDDPHAPSDRKGVKRFIRAAARHGIQADVIGPDDFGRIAEYDALFLRETTQVNHHSYRLAARAAAEGLVVMDEPEAIVRCTNKVFQAEVFARHGIPAPRTVVLHSSDPTRIGELVGWPAVLKKPDGAFSLGVVKVQDADEARRRLDDLLRETELVVAQEFVPSAFDWRIGVLEGRALYACRYHMARGHWQIVSRSGRSERYGRVETIPVGEAPVGVVSTAERAASLFGRGMFGVDLKEVNGRVMVMEVNDNPNLEAGYEDSVLGDELWDALARWFLARLDARGTGGGP